MANQSNQEPVPCSQCGAAVAYMLVNGVPMCVDCNYKAHLSHWMDISHAIAMVNYADAEMANAVGMPHLKNPIAMPKPPAPPISYNNQNVTVHGGVVGAINFGNVEEIKVNLQALQQSGEGALAEGLAALTDAIVAANDADEITRNELLEQISDLSSQVTVSEQERKPGRIKALLAAVQTGSAAISSAAGAWGAVEPLLKGHFGL